MSLFEEIQKITCEQLKVTPEEIKLETSFVEDLGVDSLDIIELVMALEEKYDIEIPDEDAEEMTKMSNVVQYIENRIISSKRSEE